MIAGRAAMARPAAAVGGIGDCAIRTGADLANDLPAVAAGVVVAPSQALAVALDEGPLGLLATWVGDRTGAGDEPGGGGAGRNNPSAALASKHETQPLEARPGWLRAETIG